MPLPRSLANLKREITERADLLEKNTKCRKATRRTVQLQGAPRGLPRVLPAEFGTLRDRTVLAPVRDWWCRCPTQTRDHLFKVCPEWRTQQKILWADVQKESGRWKSRWKIRDLLADGR